MKILIFIILLFVSSSFVNDIKKTDTFKIEVINCMSSIKYTFDGDSVIIHDKHRKWERFSSNKADKNTVKKFISIAKQMLETKGDEVLDNPCIMDGFHIKIYLTLNSNKKIIFIGNYYDQRVDSLINIFDTYINRENEILKYNAFRYSKSPDRVKKMIEKQNLCTDTLSSEMKKHLLNNFCEY